METQSDGASSNEVPAQDGACQPTGGDAPFRFGEDVQACFAMDDLDEPDQVDVSQDPVPLQTVPAASIPDPLALGVRAQELETWDVAVPSAVPIIPVTSESAKEARQARQIEELKQVEWTPPGDDPQTVEEYGQDGPGGTVIILGVIAAALLVVFLFMALSMITTLT